MSYIRAKVVDQEDPATAEHGFAVPEIDFQARHDLDMNLDDEMLDFVLALIREVNNLGEDEALVVWKEIF